MARYEVEVLPWAVADARETYLYLLERDPQVAAEFPRRVAEALRALAETAHHYKARDSSIRRCPLKTFPHGVLYELEGNKVIVYAVAHPRRERLLEEALGAALYAAPMLPARGRPTPRGGVASATARRATLSRR